MKLLYRNLIWAGALALLAGQARAQNADPNAFGYYHDVARFSRPIWYGSARTNSMAGVQTALGADPSALIGNPAGLGVYRRSEFSGTPSLWFGGSDSKMNGNTDNGYKGQFNMGNLALIFNDMRDDITAADWRGGTFGISFSTTNNFNQRYNFSGSKSGERLANGEFQRNSIIDVLVDAGNTQPFAITNDQAFPNLNATQAFVLQGYQTYLLDSTANGTGWQSLIPTSDIAYNGTLTTRGSQSQLDLGWGGNYKNVLFMGAGVGFHFLRYTESWNVTETMTRITQTDQPYYAGYEGTTINYQRDYTVNGTGINARLGLIAKPHDAVRVGISYQSPVLYNITDESANSRIQTNFNGATYENVDGSAVQLGQYTSKDIANNSRFSYTMVTPHRLGAGLALFAGSAGFISADVEYQTYRSASQYSRNDGVSLSADDRSIANVYQNVLNVRVGAEARLIDVLRLRAGYAVLPSPYKSGYNENLQVQRGNTQQITGGLGLRLPTWYADLALMYMTSANRYAYHQYAPGISNDLRNTSVSVTVGGYF